MNKEERLDKLHYKLFVGFAILKIGHYSWIQQATIGGNLWYNLLTIWLPLLIGMITLGIYSRKFLLEAFFETKGWFRKIYIMSTLFISGLVISYVSFSTVADIIWEQFNRIEVEKNPVTFAQCKVTRFWSGKGTRGKDQIEFDFKGYSEKILVGYQLIKRYKDENPRDYILRLSLIEGLNETYIIDSWQLDKIH